MGKLCIGAGKCCIYGRKIEGGYQVYEGSDSMVSMMLLTSSWVDGALESLM